MRMRRLAAVRVRNMASGLFVPVGRIMCLTPGLLSFVLRQGGLMVAMHRRPPLTVAPPPELVTFDPDEWPGGEWWQSFELWGDARMAFVKAHGFGVGVCVGCVAGETAYPRAASAFFVGGRLSGAAS
jgi:hypothetical protein